MFSVLDLTVSSIGEQREQSIRYGKVRTDMGFIEVMKQRGMMAQVTHEEELKGHLDSGIRTAYAGFDPTASSLHVGHLLPVLALRRWQQAGHRAVALMGGGTALIGDPSGKTEMRQMLGEDEIGERIENFKHQLSRFLDFSSESKGLVVNNADWLKQLSYLPFLRDVGPHFTVNRMLAAECFKQRMEKGLSFLEFNYMILQSYDFYHLNKTYDCSVQLGGDDQWSNMLGGMDLIRRKEGRQAFCFTVPLLTNSQGKKMGKTEQGAVWIDPSLTSPYDFFQYFRNVEDDMVGTCLYYFSDLPVEEVERLSSLEGQNINEAKIELAFHATCLVHGDEEAKKAKDAAGKLFQQGGSAPADAPVVEIDREQLSFDQDELGLVDVLLASKLFSSKSEIRRLIQQNGLSIESRKVADIEEKIQLNLLDRPEGVFIKKGKKHFYSIKLKN